jgi:hypothetical protein
LEGAVSWAAEVSKNDSARAKLRREQKSAGYKILQMHMSPVIQASIVTEAEDPLDEAATER